ncbi:MAG: CDP-alcohol phosphatidyltransferase family protein [Myxococcota bacterium]
MQLRWRPVVPNTLTVARLVLAALFPWMPESWWLPVVAVSLATEFFDGILARRLDAVTRFGQVMDPIADKAFILVVALTMMAAGRVTPLELLFVGARDVAVLLGALAVVVAGRPRLVARMEPRLPGKATTTLQFAFLLWLLVAGPAPPGLLIPIAIVSVLAGLDYLVSFARAHSEWHGA